MIHALIYCIEILSWQTTRKFMEKASVLGHTFEKVIRGVKIECSFNALNQIVNRIESVFVHLQYKNRNRKEMIINCLIFFRYRKGFYNYYVG